jgi:hypothetical protein
MKKNNSVDCWQPKKKYIIKVQSHAKKDEDQEFDAKIHKNILKN